MLTNSVIGGSVKKERSNQITTKKKTIRYDIDQYSNFYQWSVSTDTDVRYVPHNFVS